MAGNECSRNCSGQSTLELFRTPAFNSIATKRIQSKTVNFTPFQHTSNESQNLVRDQGVGGSNPLSPTKKTKWIKAISHMRNRFFMPASEGLTNLCCADSGRLLASIGATLDHRAKQRVSGSNHSQPIIQPSLRFAAIRLHPTCPMHSLHRKLPILLTVKRECSL
jgi:hypothetical protein